MSVLFFTKRVFQREDAVGFCGVDLDEIAVLHGLRNGHDLLADPDRRFYVWRNFLLPALKDSLLWRELHWLRFIVDRTDRYATRIWIYGRVKASDYLETYIWPLLQTHFISYSAPLHLATFNRAWSLASFSATRRGSAFKIESVRDLESLNEDNFNLLISDDHDVVYDFQ